MNRDCGAWINLLSHKVKKCINATLSDLGVTGVQSRVLHYILIHCESGPVFQKDVEDAFGLSRSTATGILNLLEKGGLLRREPVDYDARLKSLVPTEAGRALHEQVGAYMRGMEDRLTQGISPGQIQLFLETAAHMSENLDAPL